MPSPRYLSRRSAVTGAAGGLSALLAAACSSGGSQTPSGAAYKGSGPTIRLVYISQPKAPPEQAILDKLFVEFTAEFPRIQVDIQPTSDVQVIQKALQLHVAGSTADLVEHSRDGRDLRDSVKDIKPFMNRDKVNPNIFVPTAVEALSYEGKFMGIPIAIAVDALFYNPDILRQIGLAPPPVTIDDRSWTMEKFQEYAIKLTQRPDRFGWGGNITGGFDWMDAATYFGVGIWDAKTEKVLVNTAEFKRGLQYWTDLYTRHAVVPTGDEVRAMGNARTGLGAGKVAMEIDAVPPPTIQTKLALAALPYSGPGKNISGRMSPSVVFAGNASQLDATWEVLKWTLEPGRAARQADARRTVVAGLLKAAEITRKTFQDQTGIDPQPWFTQANSSKFVAWGMYAYPETETVARAEITPRFQNELLTGKMSVNDFALFAEQQLKGAIAKGK